MQASNANPESRSKDLGWFLLGEYSLSKLLPDLEKSEKITAGLLSQTVRELGIPVECVENIEMILRNLNREALARFKEGTVELPGRIRIFCQKKMIDEEMKGGGGYFVIERSTASSTSGCTEPQHLIDLYFYEERE